MYKENLRGRFDFSDKLIAIYCPIKVIKINYAIVTKQKMKGNYIYRCISIKKCLLRSVLITGSILSLSASNPF